MGPKITLRPDVCVELRGGQNLGKTARRPVYRARNGPATTLAKTGTGSVHPGDPTRPYARDVRASTVAHSGLSGEIPRPRIHAPRGASRPQ